MDAHALGGSRVEHDADRAVPAVEQQLDERAAGGVADEDRGLLQAADHLLEAGHDRGQGEFRDRGRVGVERLHLDLEARVGREETPLTRLTTYARAHLTEPDLGPQRLAAAHNVSLRRLYSEFAGAGLHLEQWLIAERLERARAQLVSRSGRHRSIAAVARACGFADASHFARRFRQAYGLTHREWQRESARRGAEPAGSAE